VVVSEERIDETRVYRRREARSLKNVFQSRRAPSSEDDWVEEVAAEDGAACVEALLTEQAFWRGVDRVGVLVCGCDCCLVVVAFKIEDCNLAGDFVLASRFCCAFCGLT
jgi:hypothetical protein